MAKLRVEPSTVNVDPMPTLDEVLASVPTVSSIIIAGEARGCRFRISLGGRHASLTIMRGGRHAVVRDRKLINALFARVLREAQ